jgi:hypothetical protein
MAGRTSLRGRRSRGAALEVRTLGQLKEARQLSSVRNPGGLLTKTFKDIASEAGIALH